MNYPNNNNQSSGGKDGKFGGKGFGGGRRGGHSSMHKATCSDCGNACEVPFRPTGDKPVYCSACFSKHGGGNSGKFRGGQNKDSGNRNFKPSFDNKHGGGNTGNYDMQLKQMNIKIDKILSILAPDDSEETKDAESLDRETSSKEPAKSAEKKKSKKKTASKKKTVKKKPPVKKKNSRKSRKK